MEKRAQLSIFLLLCFVILVSGLFIYYMESEKVKEYEIELPISLVPVNLGIEDCIKQTAEDAVVFVGLQGGYYNLPVKSVDDFFYQTAYYFYEQYNMMPSIEVIQNEISAYINENIDFCVSDLFDNSTWYDISTGEMDAQTLITQEGIAVTANYPVSISYEDTTHKIEEFTVTVENIRLKDIYNAISEYMEEQLKEHTLICTSCLVDIGERYDLYFDLERINSTIVIFTVIDYNSTIDDESYYFIFANKYIEYSCSSPPPDADASFILDCLEEKKAEFNYTFSLEDIPDMTATVNVPFYYKVEAVGYNLSFYDYTDLFDIDENTGIISFTPTEDQVGSHVVWIKAEDGLGEYRYGSFLLDIKK